MDLFTGFFPSAVLWNATNVGEIMRELFSYVLRVSSSFNLIKHLNFLV